MIVSLQELELAESSVAEVRQVEYVLSLDSWSIRLRAYSKCVCDE